MMYSFSKERQLQMLVSINVQSAIIMLHLVDNKIL